MDDANKFVNADKEAHFGQLSKTFHASVKQPVELIETQKGLVMIACVEDYDNEEYSGGYIGAKETKGYHIEFGSEAYDDKDNSRLTGVDIYSQASGSMLSIAFGWNKKEETATYMDELLASGGESKIHNGERYSHTVIHASTRESVYFLSDGEYKAFMEYPSWIISKGKREISDDMDIE